MVKFVIKKGDPIFRDDEGLYILDDNGKKKYLTADLNITVRPDKNNNSKALHSVGQHKGNHELVFYCEEQHKFFTKQECCHPVYIDVKDIHFHDSVIERV